MDQNYEHFSELGNSRQELVNLIAARTGVKAYSYETKNIRPPAYVVFPDTPYISDDLPRTMGNINSNYQVLILTSKIIENKEVAAADELDLMIEKLIKKFNMINHSNGDQVLGINLLRIDGTSRAKSREGEHFASIGYFVVSNQL